ncbi:hypothetical protein I79_012571 [Cricetulus griseus]|uniref:Secreted protein n=1 Tax=Cricetulus griseus TaxID=10029 RepID=G3HP65_CRIGR|nr:hypothetical protein I79_012571 [Cricetulus griseus]
MSQWLKHLLLFQRTQVLFPALILDTSQLLVITAPRDQHSCFGGGWAPPYRCAQPSVYNCNLGPSLEHVFIQFVSE